MIDSSGHSRSKKAALTEEERARNEAARSEMERAVTPADIKLSQQVLNSLGYQCGTPTGIVDGKTRNAVIDYQFDQGLSITGWIDTALVAQLKTQAAIRQDEH